MPLVLLPRAASDGPLAVDLAGILPDRIRGLAAVEIARLPIAADGRRCELGELFAISGSGDDDRIECRGDFSRVHRVGAGLAAGSAGDWLACEMTGGAVHVGGRCGDNAAAALPGSPLGMRGGMVIVAGDAGGLAGARMRRGVLAIGGACGAAAAFEMRAGTVVVAGAVGAHPAAGMRRGSLVALGSTPRLPPTFTKGAAWTPAFLPLLLRRLAAAGIAAAPPGRWRQWHGDLLAGGRGEVWCPEAA